MKIITIPVTPFAQNCRIIACESTQEAIVVDPGGDSDKIIATLTSNSLTLKAVWLTHGHLDHVGAADVLRRQFDIKIIGPHKDERFWFDNLPMQAQMFGFPPIDPFYPDEWLSHGDTLSLGKLKFDVMHCPGHTPGHIVFFHRASKLAQVGDVLFCGSVGRTDFPRGNQKQLIQSIQENLFPLGDDVHFIPGHGPMGTIGEERINNPFVGVGAE